MEHLHRPLSLAELAAHARMSVRAFCRRFQHEVGMPPGRWPARQRAEEHARSLLETTDLPVERIAAQAGFGTTAALRQHPAAVLGVSPTAYRTAHRPYAGPARAGRLDGAPPVAHGPWRASWAGAGYCGTQLRAGGGWRCDRWRRTIRGRSARSGSSGCSAEAAWGGSTSAAPRTGGRWR
ncbi:helix-turn-helix domain-containing protein [Streptomyces sp. NPDC048595]|uniref:helix-turn-helix domain-containing protein n=1 Tax=Streptomyces sp. NPDC048595 TaxID=3365576 RepID=UPI00372249C3